MINSKSSPLFFKEENEFIFSLKNIKKEEFLILKKPVKKLF